MVMNHQGPISAYTTNLFLGYNSDRLAANCVHSLAKKMLNLNYKMVRYAINIKDILLRGHFRGCISLCVPA